MYDAPAEGMGLYLRGVWLIVQFRAARLEILCHVCLE